MFREPREFLLAPKHGSQKNSNVPDEKKMPDGVRGEVVPVLELSSMP
jgi:hypothetical protein